MIYAGVTAENGGAYAVLFGNGEDIDARSFSPSIFEKIMNKAQPMDIRCVIEMPEDGIIERAVKPVNPAVYTRMYCNSRGIPFMFVKQGTVRRAYDMKAGQTMAGECRLRYPHIELRGSTEEQEATAAAVLLAKYARRYL